jgi:DNA-binding NarL/FixJ family response regulator
MSKKLFDFSHAEYEHFLEVCPFTDEEIKILEMRRRGKSDIEICFATNLSERTVSRRINSIVKKISKEI